MLTASIVYGVAMFVGIAIASNFNGFLVGMAISGLGFGMYAPSISRSLSTCCRTRTTPPRISACSTWPALFPFSIAPGMGTAILAIGGGSYGVLYRWPGSAPSSQPSPSCP